MPLTFDDAEKRFKNSELNALAADSVGLRYLKIRSLSRPEILRDLFLFANLPASEAKGRGLFRAAFHSPINMEQIDRFIKQTYEVERSERAFREEDLINQLYRLQEFDWGGLHQNSLEKTIVNNYIKKISNYDALCEAVEGDLHASLKGYVKCSWYNHWTSIVIEDIFKSNARVLPAVGLIKQIDFFIDDIPYDLKVTYLPEGFVKKRRDADGLGVELTLLKQAAKKFRIPINKELPAGALMQDLWVKVLDHPDDRCRDVVKQLDTYRSALVTSIVQNPIELSTWLYENQGLRRFDASNRLFLVLVDQRNYFDSWKLKRAKPLLESKIAEQLNQGRKLGRETPFHDDNDIEYKPISDLIVVTNAE